MFDISDDHIETIKKQPWAKDAPVDDVFWEKLTGWIALELLPDFVTKLTNLLDSILTINPDHSEIEILELIAIRLVESLGATMASVRIYDPDTKQLLSYGSYPSDEETRASQIAIEGSVAGKVITTGQLILFPISCRKNYIRIKVLSKEKGLIRLWQYPLRFQDFSLMKKTVQVLFRSTSTKKPGSLPLSKQK